jgi:hypothetical protein
MYLNIKKSSHCCTLNTLRLPYKDAIQENNPCLSSETEETDGA